MTTRPFDRPAGADDGPQRLGMDPHPDEPDAFVGRAGALEELHRCVERAAVVTVFGSSGVGKSRLALHLARGWPGVACFCDLTDASTVDTADRAVSRALGDGVDDVGATLAALGPCLVVLDGFDVPVHVAVRTLDRWTVDAPQARFLVTAREVTGVAGEVALALAPLSPADGAELLRVRAGLGVEADGDAVDALVRLLDGMALPIELAAARTRSRGLPTVAAELSERIGAYAATGARHTREVTLRLALDWTVALLPEETRQALQELAAGGSRASHPDEAVEALVEAGLVRSVGLAGLVVPTAVREHALARRD